MREGILYAFDEKTTIDVANTKRDLLRDGGSDPEKTSQMNCDSKILEHTGKQLS